MEARFENNPGIKLMPMGIKPLDTEPEGFRMVYMNNLEGVAPTPHCVKHGAMNKITIEPDGSGIWRCISTHSRTKVKVGNAIGYKENDNTCRAVCYQQK